MMRVLKEMVDMALTSRLYWWICLILLPLWFIVAFVSGSLVSRIVAFIFIVKNGLVVLYNDRSQL